MILLRELIAEYTDEEKRQMGIPLDAVARGGVWYVGDKYVGKVEDEKFVSAEEEPQNADAEQVSMEGAEVLPVRALDYRAEVVRNRVEFIRSLGVDWDSPHYYAVSFEQMEEMQHHAQTAQASNSLKADIVYWQEDGIWRRPKERREKIFRKIDSTIDDGHRVKSVPYLYRGIHNKEGKVKHITYEVFTKYRQGNIIKLPPSGFTMDMSQALGFANLGHPKLSVFFRLQNKPGGLEALHISEITSNFSIEREVIARSGEYKILSVKMQPIVYTPEKKPEWDTWDTPQSDDTDKETRSGEFIQNGKVNLDNVDSLNIFIDLEQLDDITNEQVSQKSSQTITDMLFGDTMRGTEKNIKLLEKRFGNK